MTAWDPVRMVAGWSKRIWARPCRRPTRPALRLRRAGESDAEIARALGIDEDAIPALLRLADAKVAEHRARGSATQT